MAFTVTISSNATAVARQLAQNAPRALVGAMVGGMREANAAAVANIQKTKLTAAGPKYLNVQTGRLRRSGRATDPRAQGGRVVSEIGSNVKYAAVHEYGFRGTEKVRGFVRRVKSRDTRARVDGKRRRTASGVAFVRAHSRRVNVRERRPFRDGIEESRPRYRTSLETAIVAAWKAPQP